MKFTANTKIYGSFSNNPGTSGSKFFNTYFEKNNLDCIYKPFKLSVFDEDVITAMRLLKIKGVGVSMPFKKIAYTLSLTDDEATKEIQAVNTLVLKNDNIVYGYNTDWISVKRELERVQGSISKNRVIILGRGGYAAAVRYAAAQLNMGHQYITREYWHDIVTLRDELIFNATPVKTEILRLHPSNTILDSSVNSLIGRDLAFYQAVEQLKLYGFARNWNLEDEEKFKAEVYSIK